MSVLTPAVPFDLDLDHADEELPGVFRIKPGEQQSSNIFTRRQFNRNPDSTQNQTEDSSFFPPGAAELEKARITYSRILATHEINAWSCHNQKDRIGLVYNMVMIYQYFYGASEKAAFTAARGLTEAAWKHDAAEKTEDHSTTDELDDKEKDILLKQAEAQWNKVLLILQNHYFVIFSSKWENLFTNQKIAEKAKKMGLYDCQRWRDHHHRDYQKVKEDMAKMYETAFNIRAEIAYPLMTYVEWALRFHDYAEHIDAEMGEVPFTIVDDDPESSNTINTLLENGYPGCKDDYAQADSWWNRATVLMAIHYFLTLNYIHNAPQT
ncbi:hypothetical protein JW887_05255 [Candidatus Dojkabacteria bacterium]|nr:hypothetical protein [Candidatus Dojkabacteria bacterium]